MSIPDSVQEVAEIIGIERALTLVGRMPSCDMTIDGRRVTRKCLYVPRVLPLNHPLVNLIGYADAKKLATAFGGEILKLGNCSYLVSRYRYRRILELIDAGWSRERIADHMQITPDMVKNALKGKPKESKRPTVLHNAAIDRTE